MISKKTITIFMLLSSISFSTHAIDIITTNSIEKTKVIIAFSNKTNKITGIFLYESIKSKNGEYILKPYENSTFFIGYIKGDFVEKSGIAKPTSGSEITIIKDNEYILYDKDIPALLKKNQYPQTDIFFKEENFLKEKSPKQVYYEAWPCYWKASVFKNDKNYLIINIL